MSKQAVVFQWLTKLMILGIAAFWTSICEASSKAPMTESDFVAVLQEQCRAIDAKVTGYHSAAVPKKRGLFDGFTSSRKAVDLGSRKRRMIFNVQRHSENISVAIDLFDEKLTDIIVASKGGALLAQELAKDLQQRLPALPVSKSESVPE